MFRKPEEVASIIARSVERISRDNAFVKAKRAATKGSRMEPTDLQTKLMRYIMQHDRIPFEETIGMNWTFLGGLLTRGLVTWQTIDGQAYLVVQKGETR